MGRFFLIFLVFFLIQSRTIFAQDEIQLLKAPPVENFDKSTYNAENQNWCIVQNKKGIIYSANTLGLLEFDGEDWVLHPSNEPLHTITLANDKIFVGGINTIGYYEKVEDKFQYHPITDEDFQDEIWKSFRIKNKILFQSFNSFYIYDLETNELSNKKLTQGNISYAFLAKDNAHFYYQILFNDIQKDNLKSTKQTISDPQLKNWMIKYIHEINDHELFIGTFKNGLYLFKNNKLILLNNELSSFLSEARLNVVQPIEKDVYAFGTLDKGVVVGNIKTGKILYYLSTKNGLKSNRIHSLYYNDGILWAGSELGISKIKHNYPVSFIKDPLSEIGPVYDAVIFNKKIYIGTNQGVYYSNDSITAPVLHLKLLPSSQGQVWNLEVIDNQLFCGHNEGVFEIKGNQFIKKYNNGGGYTFLKSQFNPDVMFQTSYYGLNIWKKENGTWIYKNTIKEINSLTRDIIELDDTSLIITDTWGKLFRVLFTDDYQKVKYVDDLSHQDRFEDSHRYRLFTINNDKVVTTDESLVYLNESNQEQIDLQDIEYISEGIDQLYIVKAKGQLNLFDANVYKFQNIKSSIKELGQNQVYNYENIHQIDKENFFIAFVEGFGIFNPKKVVSYKYKHYYPEIRAVQFFDHKNKHVLDTLISTVPKEYNSLKIEFSSMNYYEKVRFSVMLEGYDSTWVDIGYWNKTQYQNLPSGAYDFWVRDNESQLKTHYKFEIEKSFLLSKTMIGFYTLLGFLCIVFIIRFNRLFLKKEKLKILLKKREDLNHQREINKKHLALMEANELKQELISKDESLSELLAQSSKNKDILTQLKDQVDNMKSVQSNKKDQAIKKLDTILNSEYDDKENWLVFEASFKKMHAHFFENLKKAHPNLTAEDLKLCAYLKINLTTKELAPIFNITPKSVDLKRYRLRKKMGLDRGIKLNEYFDKF